MSTNISVLKFAHIQNPFSHFFVLLWLIKNETCKRFMLENREYTKMEWFIYMAR